MLISVTQKHIDRARTLKHRVTYRACRDCPIAIAITEATGQRFYVGTTDYWTKDLKPIELPAEAVDFRQRFDYRQSVGPTEFELAIRAMAW